MYPIDYRSIKQNKRNAVLCDGNINPSLLISVCTIEINRSGLLVLADDNLSVDLQQDNLNTNVYDLSVMPYAAMALGVIHNFCNPASVEACPYLYYTPLVLDVTTVAEILDEKIAFWNDSKIVQLNPDKNLPNAMIQAVSGSTSSLYTLIS